MKIIPVIDYMRKQVVLANKGERGTYKAVNSELCKQSDLHSVIESLIPLANFNIIYIADLDSIENHEINHSFWQGIFTSYPQLEFWCDFGIHATSWNRIMSGISNARPVVGSESFNNLQDLSSTLKGINNANPLLSLDFKNSIPLGPHNLLTNTRCWPEEIIILSLNRVGSVSGPDYELIQTQAALLANNKIYIGGGIRNVNDIDKLEALGISGVLLAKSLHSLTISAKDLEKFSC